MEILLAIVVLVAIVWTGAYLIGLAIERVRDTARLREWEDRHQAEKLLLDEFRSQATRRFGKSPEVVEAVYAKGGSEYGSYRQSHYAAIDDALCFGPPIDSLWTRDQIKGAKKSAVRDHAGDLSEYVVELRLDDLQNPRTEIWFLHKSEADDFFARLGLVGQLR